MVFHDEFGAFRDVYLITMSVLLNHPLTGVEPDPRFTSRKPCPARAGLLRFGDDAGNRSRNPRRAHREHDFRGGLVAQIFRNELAASLRSPSGALALRKSPRSQKTPCKAQQNFLIGGSLIPQRRRTGRYRSGQTGQTVNLLAYAFNGSNPFLPTLLGAAFP